MSTKTETTEKRRLDLYEREVIAREKQANALEVIGSRFFIHHSDGKFGADNIAEGVVCIALAISDLASEVSELTREVAAISEKLEA